MDTVVDKRIAYLRESFAECWAEAQELAKANYAEVSLRKGTHFNLRTDMYHRLEEFGLLRIFTARWLGQLIAYQCWAVTKHEFTDETVAKAGAFYVHPDHRGWVGPRLEQWSEDCLALEGVQWLYHASPIGLKCIDRFLAAFNYTPVETLYTKRLAPNAPKDA